ncbi:uncharacterized protein LOC124127462 [Haliotis rufescens]|uniref:uncharacterized protein LOC124127462 n=1 Tax=Haliotis rufescens TaxID=6454 RepID=UPI00201F9B22|nr:uncharacterized protein LOC124127462 [Haliotis rufescens]
MDDYASELSKSSIRSRRSSSSISHVSSVRLKEEQKKVELLVKAAALKKKHELEVEKVRLKMEEEELDMAKTEMAISDARWKVLDEYDFENEHSSRQSTGFGKQNTRQPMDFSDRDPLVSDTLSVAVPRFTRDREKENESLPEMKYYTPAETPVNFPTQQMTQDPLGMSTTSDSAIATVIRQLRKPVTDLMVFSGNPLEYRKFMRQFKTKILVNTDDFDERLNYLEQFTSGEVCNIVSSYGYLDAEQGYPAAIKELQQRYGNEDVIVNAFIQKALEWPYIRADNSKALDEYAVFLSECENTVKSNILDNTDNIRRLITKLPYHYQEGFRNRIQSIRASGKSVKFSDLVEFVRKESWKANDPMFGKDALQDKDKHGNPSRATLKTRNQLSRTKLTLATEVNTPQTSQVPRSPASPQPQTSKKQTGQPPPADRKCLCCESNQHFVSECEKFTALSYDEIVNFIRSKRLCFRCLRKGHLSKDCRSNITCTKCQRRHNALLHREEAQVIQHDTIQTSSCLSSAMGVGLETDGTCTMVIMPVKVLMKGGLRAIETYAFLDPGSSASFCTESLMRQLGASGKPMKLNIDSMGKPRTINTYAVSGMQVCNLTMENHVALPKMFTVEKLPVSKIHIPTSDDIKDWTHLRDVEIPIIDAEIGIMIGNNIADAYTPIEVRSGPDHAPHATRTRLGWALWNVTRPASATRCLESIRCTVNRTDVAVHECEEFKQLDRMVRHSFNIDFPERIIDDEKQHSQEDKVFLKGVDESIKLCDGHYEISLPFREQKVSFPNNYSLAFKRLMGLKRQMEQDNKFRLEYTDFMNKMLEKGYAEHIPDDEPEPEPEDGFVWYIPHHGVYHPKKVKLRVVFNCAATYNGTSLNQQLLSGPDLTNNLIGVLVRFRQENVAAKGDIESMFYQVWVTKAHWNYQRFLWWQDGDYGNPPLRYRMKVHMFGTTSSPSCANAALLKTANDNEEKYEPEIAEIVRNIFYVDDCLFSEQDVTKTVSCVTQESSLCQQGGFRLTKWVSNSAEVLDKILPEDRAEGVKSRSI